MCTAQVAGDGYSILDKAVMEHNLIAIARIYENISIDEVAAILSLEPEKAEKVSDYSERARVRFYVLAE